MTFEARGVWIEMLTSMWDAKERGKLEGTLEQLSGLLGCPVDKLWPAICEIYNTKTGDVLINNGVNGVTPDNVLKQLGEYADETEMKRKCNADVTGEKTPCINVLQALHVTNCNVFVTVINRRMFREDKERKSTYYRVKKFRREQLKRPCNTNVTLASSSSSSLYNNKENETLGVTLSKTTPKPTPKYYKNDTGNFVCSLCQKSFMGWNTFKNHKCQEPEPVIILDQNGKPKTISELYGEKK